MYTFFLIVTPGLEPLSLRELQNKWDLIFPGTSFSELKFLNGGIELDLPLDKGLKLNYFLKIPTRILLRIGGFKCRDYPKLYKKIQTLPWRDFLPEVYPSFEVSCSKSRLFHTNRIAKTALDGMKKYFLGNPSKEKDKERGAGKTPPQVYLRFENDVCTVSLDTSGKRLGEREYKTSVGKAPLRENLASALLYSLTETLGERSEELTLIDPMCGSGTFLFESQSFFSPQKKSYPFEIFPCLQKEKDFSPNDYSGVPLFYQCLGIDRDLKQLEECKKNLTRFQKLFALNKANISFQEGDLFENSKSFDGKNVVILNPPYGKRVKIQGELSHYYLKVLERIKLKFSPLAIGLLIPKNKAPVLKGYEKCPPLGFPHGGIPVEFTIYLKLET